MRIPDDVAASVKRVAALNGITPGEQIKRAFDWWLREDRDRIADDAAAAAEAMRRG